MTNRILAAGFIAVVLSIWGAAWYLKKELSAAIYSAGSDVESAVSDLSDDKRTLYVPQTQSPGRPNALERLIIDEAAKRGQQ